MSQKPPSSSPLPPNPKLDAKPSETLASKEAEPTTTGEAESTRTAGVPISLDFSPEQVHEQPQRTGARSSKGSLSTGERKRRRFTRVTLALLGLAFAGQVVYMGREWEEDELKAKKKASKLKLEDVASTRLGRTTERFTDIFDYFNKPAWPELLPPPMPAPYQKPYTLILSIDDLLVTSTWDRHHGWRTAKRPGVDYFLAYISQFYEVVIFTSQPFYTAEPILAKLDKYGFFITYRLFREGTKAVNGKAVKDLSYLNRDLSKVVELDTNPDQIGNPENAVIVPKWSGDPNDRGLIAMIPFLESIAIYRPPDVRPILKAYQGKNIPVEYAKTEAEMKAKHVAEWKTKHKPSVVGASTFGSLFGVSSGAPSQPRDQPPPTYLELKRREAQQHYLEEQQYIEKNRAELDKLLEQDQQAMSGQVPANLWEALGQFAGRAPEQGQTAPVPTGGSIPQPPGAPAAAMVPASEVAQKK